MVFHIRNGTVDFLYGLADLRDFRYGLGLVRSVLLLLFFPCLYQVADLFQDGLDFLMHKLHILLQAGNLG